MTDSGMAADIARTPALLAELLQRAAEMEAFRRAHLTPGPGGRLYAFGCGDGLMAAQAAAGDQLTANTALEMLAYTAPRLTASDRVLAISMSGNVDRGLEAASALQRSGAGIALLTNGEGGQLAALGLPVLSLAIPPLRPFLCGTSTYSATLLALLLITGEADPAATTALLAAMPDVIKRARMTVAALPGELAGVRLLSAGRNVATAAMGAAKLVEVTRLPSWSGDIEEFAHSQFWSARQGELVIYLAAHPIVAELASHSAAQLGAFGFQTAAIETADAPVPDAALRVSVPAVSEPLSALALAPCVQMIAWHLSRAGGLDPDTRTHLRDDTARFETSRRLTRRALVGTGH